MHECWGYSNNKHLFLMVIGLWLFYFVTISYICGYSLWCTAQDLVEACLSNEYTQHYCFPGEIIKMIYMYGVMCHETCYNVQYMFFNAYAPLVFLNVNILVLIFSY